MPEPTAPARRQSTWLNRTIGAGVPEAPPKPPPAAESVAQAPAAVEKAMPTLKRPDAPEPAAGGSDDANDDAKVGEGKPAPRRQRTRRTQRPAATRSTAPAIGERQGQARFQARLTPTLAEAVEETTLAIQLRTGLSLNEIRTIAVWAILGDAGVDNVTAFVCDVVPDWQSARQAATLRQQTASAAETPAPEATAA